MNKKLYWSLLTPIVISPILIVASCSSDNSQKNDIELATERITESLQNYHLTMGQFKKPSQIKANEIETEMMQPSLNFGFETKLEKIAHNDKTGELTLKVKITRATNENKEFEINLNGFLTEEQEVANKEIKPEEYFGTNGSSIILVTDQGNTGLIPKEITEDLLLNKYIDIQNTSSSSNKQNVLFQKQLPNNIKLEVSDIKQAFFYGIEEPIIQAQIKLVKDDKLKTAPFLLSVAGFNAHALYLNKTVDYAIQTFDTLGKLMIDPDNPIQNNSYYINKKPSEIKNKEEIKKYLRNYSTAEPQIFEINKIVENSANDKEGSIMVEFKFKNIIDQSTKDKVIKLYGFRPVND